MMNRNWMYNRRLPQRAGLTDEFFDGVNEFLNYALSQAGGSKIRCPCFRCANTKFYDPEIVKEHLYKKGFTPNYYRWTCHGETINYEETISYYNMSSGHGGPAISDISEYSGLNPQQRMVFDVAGPTFIPYWAYNVVHEQFESSQLSDNNPNSNQWQTDEILMPNCPTNFGGTQTNNVSRDEEIALSKRFWDVLRAADEPIATGCENHTQLSAISRLLNIKSQHNMPESCYNSVVQLIGELLPRDHTLPGDYYHTKKVVKELGLPVRKIDICPEGCMIYWKDDIEKDSCKFCNHPRYKCKNGKRTTSPHKQLRYLPLIPRLQRLYASKVTAEHMRWHAEHEIEEGIMCHPSDSEAWKHFDRSYPDFASESRNVRLGLCADGFTPFGQSGKVYSCWPIIVTPYNLPPAMCMKTPYMFLTMIVPGPRNPKKLIDVCLQPLIEELMILWHQGVWTYDISREQHFLMRAALLWTINDFPAYGMLSGWSTTGIMACPICMEDTKAFRLHYSGKPSWFDCHRRFLPLDHPYRRNKRAFYRNRAEMSNTPHRLTGQQMWDRVKNLTSAIDNPRSEIHGYGTQHKWTKKSIFWDLPYWGTLLIRHNLDIMHIEKNVFDNVFNTVMDIKGKSKDTMKARKDLKLYCNRPELQVDEDHYGPKPKAVYTLTKGQRREICDWIKSLRFPDGYASNISRCVQIDECRLIGMKSHDCHIFMQRLLPTAFREMLPDSIWGPLTEVSQMFQLLCSPTLSITKIQELEDVVPLILCKLERIFPPSFFDSMEHVIIHLPYESKVGGPVQYRWMYPFERFLHHLKKKVGNKAHVEASICSSYIQEEISHLVEHYFEPHVLSRTRRPRRNDENDGNNNPSFSIFNYPGRGYGKSRTRWIVNKEEKHVAETYILLNCPEVTPYFSVFEDIFGLANDKNFDNDFTPWFKSYVLNEDNNVDDELLRSLAWGPNSKAISWPAYMINGYNFHTLERGEGRNTMNSGIWVKGSNYDDQESDYYGLLEEIIQLQYTGDPPKSVVLFKCKWFEPVKGTRVHKKYGLVEVNSKRLYKKYDPFILAQQAIQVYYSEFPGARRDRADWRAVYKTN